MDGKKKDLTVEITLTFAEMETLLKNQYKDLKNKKFDYKL